MLTVFRVRSAVPDAAAVPDEADEDSDPRGYIGRHRAPLGFWIRPAIRRLAWPLTPRAAPAEKILEPTREQPTLP